VPPLAGLFSKDEILFRTFTGTAANGWEPRRLLWLIGIVTSLLTATYMFRLVFLAFHGERRHDAPAAPAHPEEEEPVAQPPLPGPVYSDLPAADRAHGAVHPPAAHGAHGEGHLHDAPPSMAIPLIVLAIGSVAAGWIGIPNALLAGGNHIERFLDPSFEVSREAPVTEPGALQPAGPTAPAAEHAEHAEQVGLERTLMGVSTGIAVAGIGIAFFFWRRNRPAADAMARRFAPLYRLLLNKYYVDEIYDAAVVQPIRLLSTSGLWKGVDVGIIDGAVNGLGLTVSAGSRGLRRAQTGSVRTYAASLFLGVVLILGWYLWRW
jgi:NADH-quinone oxidoreductase subunit L